MIIVKCKVSTISVISQRNVTFLRDLFDYICLLCTNNNNNNNNNILYSKRVYSISFH